MKTNWTSRCEPWETADATSGWANRAAAARKIPKTGVGDREGRDEGGQRIAGIPISQLQPGDKVLATNVKTGKTSPEPVTAVMVKRDTDRYDLTIKSAQGSAVIHTTRKHLLRDVTDGTWIRAGKLKPGDHLRTANGTSATVVSGRTPAKAAGSGDRGEYQLDDADGVVQGQGARAGESGMMKDRQGKPPQQRQRSQCREYGGG